MNIGFDATAILGPMSKNRGIGNYNIGQFRKILEKNKNDKFFCLNFFEGSIRDELGDDFKNLYEEHLEAGKERILLRDPRFYKVYGSIVSKFLEKNKIDIFIITSPFDGHVKPYKKEWFAGVKVITTVYDIIPWVFKERYLPAKENQEWYMTHMEQLRWSDKIMVISQSVKEDLIEYLDFPSEQIDVIWGAVDGMFKKIEVNEEKWTGFISKHGIKTDYIMCTGGDDDRKNIGGLIESYALLDKELRDKHQLVIVCKLQDIAVKIYTDIAKKSGVEDRVVLTNFVSNEELVMLYNKAYILAFPSKYEGFGLPVVEAYACGVPVVTSNNSSLVQIAGDAAITVDPFNNHDIARGLNDALCNINREEMIERGYKQLDIYNWDYVAKLTYGVVKALFDKSQKEEKSDRKKIAMFTPMLPQKSGISDYSFDVSTALSNFYDIDIFIDDYRADKINNPNITIKNHKEYKAQDYYKTIYQVGNSTYHTYMYKYISKYPGIIELHDYNLHMVVQHECLWERTDGFEDYKKILLDDYNGDEVLKYLDKVKNEGNSAIRIQDFELNQFVLKHAQSIIVHTQEAKNKLLMKNSEFDADLIRHYAKLEDYKKVDYTKEIGKRKINIASFGHIHPNKRIIPTLKAIAKLKDKYDFKYTFVGQLDPVLENVFPEALKELGLENIVSDTGYTSLEDFINYLDESDIILNLRYPYNGESSGTFARSLAKGKVLIVNDIGSFSEVDDDAVVKIPPVDEEDESEEIYNIYSAINDLLSNPKKINLISENARKFAEDNIDLNRIVYKYIKVIERQAFERISEEIIRSVAVDEIKNKNYTRKERKGVLDTLTYVFE